LVTAIDPDETFAVAVLERPVTEWSRHTERGLTANYSARAAVGGTWRERPVSILYRTHGKKSSRTAALTFASLWDPTLTGLMKLSCSKLAQR